MNNQVTRPFVILAGSALLAAPLSTSADAQRGGGRFGGGGVSQGNARSMQVRSTSTSNVRWNGNTSVNRDVNVHRDVNVDVDHHYDYHWGDHYHPVARTAAAAAVTAAVVGSYYRYLPANCATIYRGTIIYYQCGTAWYRPVYSGTNVQYIVVTAP